MRRCRFRAQSAFRGFEPAVQLELQFEPDHGRLVSSF